MSAGLLVVGSIALDSVATPFGQTADAPGGSAVFFSAAGAILHPVQVVGVVGTDFPPDALKTLEARGVDLSGVERAPGESFRWKAKYSYDLSSRETLETRLGVFADFRPKLPPRFQDSRYVFLGNIDPELQLGVLDQVKSPELVACDTMNYWIHSKRDVLLELLRHTDILMVNDSEARELSGDPPTASTRTTRRSPPPWSIRTRAATRPSAAITSSSRCPHSTNVTVSGPM